MTVEPISKAKSAPPPSPLAPHVIRAMNMVSARLAEEGVSKSRNNSQQGYKFRGIDEVLNALATIISSERLIIIPHIQQRELTERQTKSGGALFSVTVQATYTFVSAEDASEFTVGPFYGEAMDSADKATNKAMSAAYKYMAIQTFCIPTEGDNDADATTHEVVPRTTARPSPKALDAQAGGESPTAARTSSAAAKREGAWERFTDRLEGFTDLDKLEAWWSDGSTQAAIEQMPSAWQEQAAEAYEKRQEALMSAGRP